MGPGSPPGNHGNQSGSPGRRFLVAKLASGTETRVNVLIMIFIYYHDLIIDIIVTPKHIVYLPMIFLENDVLDVKTWVYLRNCLPILNGQELLFWSHPKAWDFFRGLRLTKNHGSSVSYPLVN